MIDRRLKTLEDARWLLENSEIAPNCHEDLLALLNILIAAIEKADVAEDKDELPLSLASSLVSSQALLALLKQQTAELDAIRKLSLNLTSSLDMSTVLEAIAQEAMRLVDNARTVHIFLYRNNALEFGTALNADGSMTTFFAPRQNDLTYAVARSGTTIIVEDMHTHELFKNAPAKWSGSILGIPLKVNGRVVGVMNLSRSTVGGFTSAELRLLNMLAEQAAVAISNAMLHQTISRKAYIDTVTGLPNRRALDERLEKEVVQARRNGQPLAIIIMDLDGFKSVNDTYGHTVGDRVLRVFFNYMAQELRATDFLARYGGDELTLIMSQTALPAAMRVGDKILEKVKEFSFEAPNKSRITLGVSGGIAVYPMHGRTAAELLRAADEALYRAKRHHRGRFLVAKGLSGPLNSTDQPASQP